MLLVSSATKCFTSDVAMEVRVGCRRYLRRQWLSRRNPVERFMSDAKVTQLYEGTNQIQRLIISRQIKTAAAGNSTA